MADKKALDNAKKVNEELKKGSKNAEDFNDNIKILIDSFTSIGAAISTAIGDAIDDVKGLDTATKKVVKTYERDILNAIKKTIIGLDEQVSIQDKINRGLNVEADIQKLKEKQLLSQQVIKNRIELLQRNLNDLTGEQLVELENLKGELGRVTKLNEKQIAQLEEEAKLREKIVGDTGKLVSGIDGLLKKVGGDEFAKFFNIGGALDETAKAGIKAEKTGGKVAANFNKSKVLTQNIAKNLSNSTNAAAVLAITAKKLFDLFKKSDQKYTDLARQIGMSKNDAKDFSSNLGVGLTTIADGAKGLSAVNNALGGTSLLLNEEIITGAAETQRFFGLSAEAVGGLTKEALQSGKAVEDIRREQAEVLTDTERELGVRLDLKNVLEEANKITGLTRINIQKFPGGLAKAVSVAKSLGISMEAVGSAAGNLLNFEESITKELEAELLIGRDLNLEAARQAALAGDQEALMRELVNQAGSLEQLQSMNVLQQQALAGALGLSADQLANTLDTQSALNTQKDEELDRDAKQLEIAASQLSVSERMAIAMENLSDIISGLGILLGIAAAAAALLFISLTFGTGAAVIAAALGTIGGIALMSGGPTIKDGTLPPGGPYAITDTSKPFGSTVMTTRGDAVAVSPNIRQESSGGSMEETNKLLRAALSRPAPTVNLDSIEIGTVAGLSAFPIQ
jgi:hypothetical protein|tara:strand:- start:343 stop:2391 length:2049 start_codon:yes stop_codon:yes gene_type:complete